MKPKTTNAELTNHRCSVWTNCVTAVMWMWNPPNQKVGHFGCHEKVLGKPGHFC